MFFLTGLEFWHSWKENKQLLKARETKHNLIIAIGAVLSGSLFKLITFSFCGLVYHFRFFSLSNTWWVWILAFLANDFSFYWYHRAQHHVNWFWASHVVHHSSSDYNLLVAFRSPWFTADLSGRIIFWIWMPLLGFHPLLMTAVYELLQIYQFLLHTEKIKKLPAIIEFIFNTPSHHRVHHGSNLKYLDRNNSGVFIFWDRLFGTFQAEEEHPTYGLTEKKTSASNTLSFLFGEWRNLFIKAFSAGSLKNSINYIIKPPGWSHDNSTQTANQLRKQKSMQSKKV